MAIGNVHEMFGEELVCSSEDMIADGQTHADTLITVYAALSYPGWSKLIRSECGIVVACGC